MTAAILFVAVVDGEIFDAAQRPFKSSCGVKFRALFDGQGAATLSKAAAATAGRDKMTVVKFWFLPMRRWFCSSNVPRGAR